MRNLNVAVREWQGEVVFLHRVVPGAADRSYGIHVAKLAGVPQDVLSRSREILTHLEENAVSPNDKPRFAPEHPGKDKRGRPVPQMLQMPLFRPLDSKLREELLSLDPAQMTPLEALSRLTETVRRLKEEGP